MNEVVGAVTVTRLGSSSPDRTTADDDDDEWLERVSAAAAVGTSRSSIVDDDDDDGGSLPARLAVLVPFREDEDGTRGPQLTRLLRRLRDVFRGVAPVAVCVAEQSSDGRGSIAGRRSTRRSSTSAGRALVVGRAHAVVLPRLRHAPGPVPRGALPPPGRRRRRRAKRSPSPSRRLRQGARGWRVQVRRRRLLRGRHRVR